MGNLSQAETDPYLEVLDTQTICFENFDLQERGLDLLP